MNKYFLNTWQIVELFCEIMSQGHKISIDHFIGSNEKLHYYLNLYMDRSKANQFSSEFFIKSTEVTKINKNEKSGHKTSSIPKEEPFEKDLVYTLGKAIRDGESLSLTGKRLEEIFSHLGKKFKYSGFPEFQLSDKQRRFENTCWFLYFYTDSELKSSVRAKGISRATIRFLPFGRITITRLSIPEFELQRYIGNYNIHGSSREYLSCTLNTEDETRNLHILIHIGESFPDISIGTYDNYYEAIFCGSLLINRIFDENTIENIYLADKLLVELQKERSKEIKLKKTKQRNDILYQLIKFFPFDENNKELDPLLIRFFSEKNTLLKIPLGKNSYNKINNWLDENI